MTVRTFTPDEIAALKARASIRASGTRSTGPKPDEAPPNRAAGPVGRDDLEGAR